MRTLPPGIVPLAVAASLTLVGCPGEIDDPLAFRVARASQCPSDYDVEQDLFAATCGTLGCHTGGSIAAAGLDLTADGAGERILAHTSAECDNRPMVDTSDLLGSYFLEKLGESPACGDPMPSGLPPLNGLERTCLEAYLAELAGVEPPMRDGGVPRDAGPRMDAGPEVDAGPRPDAGPGADAGDPTTVVIQAESMTLTGYEVDAADATLIRLPDMVTSGTATATFDGASGNYQMSVFIIEEPDGQPTLTVRVAGADVATETYNLTAAANEPRTLGPYAVTVANGDTIELAGMSESDAWARIDRVELTP